MYLVECRSEPDVSASESVQAREGLAGADRSPVIEVIHVCILGQEVGHSWTWSLLMIETNVDDGSNEDICYDLIRMK